MRLQSRGGGCLGKSGKEQLSASIALANHASWVPGSLPAGVKIKVKVWPGSDLAWGPRLLLGELLGRAVAVQRFGKGCKLTPSVAQRNKPMGWMNADDMTLWKQKTNVPRLWIHQEDHSTSTTRLPDLQRRGRYRIVGQHWIRLTATRAAIIVNLPVLDISPLGSSYKGTYL